MADNSEAAMRLAIMQPYFFPYVGYFQLVAAVDRFVIYDDVAFIKNGWINRNRIVGSNGAEYFTVPLSGASSFKSIRETRCAPPAQWRSKMLRTLAQTYARAPYKEAGLALAERVLERADTELVAEVATESIRAVCAYADLTTELIPSSGQYQNSELSGATRVLDICAREAADVYVNLPGGRALYQAGVFADREIQLRFLDPVLEPYEQIRTKVFVPGLSILDLIMNLPPQEVSRQVRNVTVSP